MSTCVDRGRMVRIARATAATLALTGLAVTGLAQQAAPPRAIAPGERLGALLSQMTLEEKIGQLHQIGGGEPRHDDPDAQAKAWADLLASARSGRVGTYLGGCGATHTNRLQEAALEGCRLKIPVLFAHDVIHGYRTIFPTPLAESCSWDPDLAERTAKAAAAESRAAGVRWTFAPMVDIARDPRWGRIVEGAGEDTLLGSAFAAARVRGFQGQAYAPGMRLEHDRVLACAKHFAAYGGCEGGRDYNTVDISRLTLQQVYLPPFRSAAEAGVASYMTAFNEISGVPCSGSTFLLSRTLRDQWGFNGVVISDYNAITEMIEHGFAADIEQAAQKAMIAQVDIDMMGFAYTGSLAGLVRSGKVSEASIDRAVLRVLELKEAAGLFENPLTDTSLEARVLNSPEHRALAREAAARSIVLLKNERRTLPLGGEIRRVAVVGPLADDRRAVLGAWAGLGKPEEAITYVQGLRSAGEVRGMQVTFSQGCSVEGESQEMIDAAVLAARDSDVIIAVVGESADMSGEGYSRATLELPPSQVRLLEAMKQTGRPLVVALAIGRPLALGWVDQHADAVVVTWHGGSEAGNALADVLFGEVNPSGRLTTTFPRTTGQVPIYYNHKRTGRPHVPGDRYKTGYGDLPITPLYEFGYGLGYTTFEVTDVHADKSEYEAGEVVTLEATVRNAGDRDGAEVVQWYMRAGASSVTQPVKELIAFERVEIRAGETKIVRTEMPSERLGYLDEEGRWVLEPGTVEVHAAGGHSRSQSVSVKVTGQTERR